MTNIVPSYKDFEIDEGVLVKEALLIDFDDILNYSLEALKLCAEQLGVPGWQKVSDRKVLAGAIKEQYWLISDSLHDEETLAELSAKPRLPKPIPVYIIKRSSGAKFVNRIFNYWKEYFLLIENGIPASINHFYPDFEEDIRFDGEGKLKFRSFLFKDINLEVTDRLDGNRRTRSYKLEDEEITQKEVFDLFTKLTSQVREASGLIEPLAELVGDYLLSV